MTYQKALDGFKQLHGDIDKNNHLFVGTINPDFVRMAISALEKQIPKKPTHEASLYRCNTCPTCKQVIDINIYEEILPGQKVRIRYQRCHFCGQAIEWRN